MSLHITKTQNEFQLTGNLRANNLFEIKNYFRTILKITPSLHINISRLDQLDLSAAMMFRDLKLEAFNMQKECTVSNGQNEKIVGAFRMLEEQVLQAVA